MRRRKLKLENGESGINENEKLIKLIGSNDKHVVSEIKQSESSKFQKVGSALFYAITSILIVFVNKSVLTVYHFPSAQIVGKGYSIQTIPDCLVATRLAVDCTGLK